MRSTAAKPALTTAARSNEHSRRDALVLNHLSLVSAIATRIRQSMSVHLDPDDLFHSGVMGLFDAAERFDATKEISFGAYAKFRIRGAMLDSLRDLDSATRDVRRRQKKMDEVVDMLTAKLRRVPSEIEIAEAMGLSLSRWRQLQVDISNVNSVATQNLKRDFEITNYEDEPVCSKQSHPDVLFAKAEANRYLKAALAELPARYREVMVLYYENELTMKEIGLRLGIIESRVCQIHSAALGRLHTQLSAIGVRAVA